MSHVEYMWNRTMQCQPFSAQRHTHASVSEVVRGSDNTLGPEQINKMVDIVQTVYLMKTILSCSKFQYFIDVCLFESTLCQYWLGQWL